MDIKIMKLEQPYPYEKIAQLLMNIYFQEYGDQGSLVWDIRYTKFYFEAHVLKGINQDFAFGAFTGEKVIGILLGHWDLIRFENQLTLETLNLGVMAVDPEYRRQGIAKKMLAKLIEQAREKNIDMIFAFPEKGRYGDKLLGNHFNFTNYGKTKHLVKMMEKQGSHVLREHKIVNPILARIASIFSHIPTKPDPEGIIRLGKPSDLTQTLELINSYSSRVPLATVYTQEGFGHTLREFESLHIRFGNSWGHQWLILERNGKIHATICFRTERVAFTTKDGSYTEILVGMFSSLAFHEAMPFEEKKQFMAAILRKIRTEFPEIGLSYITTLQHEMRVFRKLKFIDDRNSYNLFMKTLSKKADSINKYDRFKEYFLEYYR